MTKSKPETFVKQKLVCPECGCLSPETCDIAALRAELATWNLRAQWIEQILCDKELCGHFTAEEIRETITGEMDEQIAEYAVIESRQKEESK